MCLGGRFSEDGVETDQKGACIRDGDRGEFEHIGMYKDCAKLGCHCIENKPGGKCSCSGLGELLKFYSSCF